MRKIFVIFSILMILLSLQIYSDNSLSDNVVVLMDCSGSMEGNKLFQAKTALKKVLKTLPENTNFALLSFGTVRGWIYELGPVIKEELIKAIDSLEAGGDTPLGTFIKIASDKLFEQREQQMGYGTYRLLIITDGEANSEDPELVENYTHQIMTRGIRVDAIGVFMASDHTLAKKAHSYRRARDTESIERAVSEVLAEINGDDRDNVGEDAFELISGLTEESANSILKAFPVYDNTPITKQEIIDYVHDKPHDSDDGKPSIFSIVLIFLGILITIKAILSRRRRQKLMGG